MSEATLNPTDTSDAPDGLRADALRAQEWAGEPFLHPDEEPGEVLASGTARRNALDDALEDARAARAGSLGDDLTVLAILATLVKLGLAYLVLRAAERIERQRAGG